MYICIDFPDNTRTEYEDLGTFRVPPRDISVPFCPINDSLDDTTKIEY